MRPLRAGTVIWLASALVAGAQVRVNPTGVSVSSMSATTVFLTFGGLRSQVAREAYWCGELVSAAPARGLRCDPATIYGQLPARYDRSRLAPTSLSDVMSIPASVVRMAYQDAERGATSTFFYVRRFVSLGGGADEFVAVTCRLTGGGARVPFSLTDVHLEFDGEDALPFIAPGETPPQVAATIRFTGTGRLIGRWEVVLPGEDGPTPHDLLTEGSLPPDERGSQRRFTQVQRFDVFLPPDGRVVLPGPDVRRLPSAAEGTYQVLLRVEATDDREGDSNLSDAGAGSGIVHSGAVAGFPLPVLRYVVAGAGVRVRPDAPHGLRLVLPRDGDTLAVNAPLMVTWLVSSGPRADFYRVEIETDRGSSIWRAMLPRTARRYEAPPWIAARAGDRAMRWRVVGLAANGEQVDATDWRTLRPNATLSHGDSGARSR